MPQLLFSNCCTMGAQELGACRHRGGVTASSGYALLLTRLLTRLLIMQACTVQVAGQTHPDCVDTDASWMDRLGNRCFEYIGKDWCTTLPYPADLPATDACCVCGGGMFPEPEPEPGPEPEPEPEPDPEPGSDCFEEPGGPEFKTCTEYLSEGFTCDTLRSPAWQSPTAEQSMLGVDTVSFGCCSCGCAVGEGPDDFGYCEACETDTYSPDGSTPYVLMPGGFYSMMLPHIGCKPCTVCEPGSMHFESQLDGCLCNVAWSAGYPCNPNEVQTGCPAVPCDLGNPQGLGDDGVLGQSWCLTNTTASPDHCLNTAYGACIGGARCSVTRDTICTACTNGTFSYGGPACETCAPLCPDGQHEASSCTLTTNRVCADCSTEYYGDGVVCHLRAVCGAGQFIQRPPQPHEDRICVDCSPGKYSNNDYDSSCVECPVGFAAAEDGGSCVDANECEILPNACANGGTCFESTTHYPLVNYNAFDCMCVDPYYGKGCRCRTIGDGKRTCCNTCDEADDGVCDDGGPPPEICQVRSSFCAAVPTCMLGTDCEDCGIRDPPANPCDGTPCGTTGFCTEVDVVLPGYMGYSCTCVTGWQGFLCDEDVDECLSSPCENGGVCTGTEAIRGTGYICDCSGTGKEGQHCALDPVDQSADSGGGATPAPGPAPPAPGNSGPVCEDRDISCGMLATAADCFNAIDSAWRLYNCARSCLQCPASVELSIGVDVAAIGGLGSPTRATFVRSLVYAFADAAAVDSSRVTLSSLTSGSVVATLRVGGATKASEPSASMAVVEVQSLHADGTLDLGDDLPIEALTALDLIPTSDEVVWAGDFVDLRAELAPQPKPEPEPEPADTRGWSDPKGEPPAETGFPLGAIGGAAGMIAVLVLLVSHLRAKTSAVHPASSANKLGGFAATALSEDANRAVAMAMFRRIDLDGSGTVDRREVQKLCEQEGLGYHGSIMREMDVDRSGEVSIEEFITWWNKHKPLPEQSVEEELEPPDDAPSERAGSYVAWDGTVMNNEKKGDPTPQRRRGDIDSDGDEEEEALEEPEVGKREKKKYVTFGGSGRARPKSASAASSSSSSRSKGGSRSRPQSASVHGRSKRDRSEEGGGRGGSKRRPQSARPSSSSGSGRSRRHEEDGGDEAEHNGGSDEEVPSKQRPQSASVSRSRKHGGSSRSKRPQSASTTEGRHRSSSRVKGGAGEGDDAWEGLLDADDKGEAGSDAEEEPPEGGVPPPKGKSKRPQSAPISRGRTGDDKNHKRENRPGSARPSSASNKRGGSSRRGVSSRSEETSRELDRVNEEEGDEEQEETAGEGFQKFQPSSLGDLPPLPAPDEGKSCSKRSGGSGSKSKRPQSSKSRSRSGDRGGSSRSRAEPEVEPSPLDDPPEAEPNDNRSGSRSAGRSGSKSRSDKKKTSGGGTRSGSRKSSVSPPKRYPGDSDSDDEGNGLAGGSKSVEEMQAERREREKKAERAARKKRTAGSSGGNSKKGPRPPSAAAEVLRGNSERLEQQVGIQKKTKKKSHRH